MKCHYEVLNVQRDATSSEIKTAYRKLALQWHPDKNLDNLHEAKEQFQIVQNAYEVLSDKQERAWYDNHREQLLRGSGSSFNDDSLNVFPYFSPSCYKGFDDEPQGFYGVYSEVFSKLAAEETDFLDDPEDVNKIPIFGKPFSPYEEVHEFYAYWMSYSTNKSYVWLDQYDISQGDNRRLVKYIERENNKIRQKARKERNEEIRRLVSFVRRKDKRVIEHVKLLKEKSEENKKKAEAMRRERVTQRLKELEEAKKEHNKSDFLQTAEYMKKLNEIEMQLAEQFGISSDDDTISEDGMESSNEDSSKTEEASENSKATGKSRCEVRNLYCSACNKLFKNIKSFENHENSKKHRENVATMEFDDDEIDLSADENATVPPSISKKSSADSGKVDEDDEQGNDTLSEDSDEVQIWKSKKKRKIKKKLFVPIAESDGNESHDEMSYNEIEGPTRSRRTKKLVNLKNAKMELEAKAKQKLESEDSVETPDVQVDQTTKIQTEAAAIKASLSTNNRRKSEKQAVKGKTQTGENEETDKNLGCAVCKSLFSSKNKLFDHLKKTGHSVPLAQSQASSQKKSKRGNR